MKEPSSSYIVPIDMGTGDNDSSVSVLLTSTSDGNFKALENFYHSSRLITNFIVNFYFLWKGSAIFKK